MSNQQDGFNKDDLQGAVSIGYAVSAVIIGAVSNRSDPMEEARRLCVVNRTEELTPPVASPKNVTGRSLLPRLKGWRVPA